MRSITCCFTGHRRMPSNKIEDITKRLSDEIDALYRKGVTEYISGGALGFDLVAASLIISKREAGYKVRLTFALPCKNQDERWTPDQQQHYRNLLNKADKIVYVSERHVIDCMKKRNYYMVDHSAFCLCALIYERSGTGQTVRYAYRNGIYVKNVAK